MRINKFFTIFDMVLIAMLTAVSIAFKAALQMLVKPAISALGVLHAGAVLGGFYMLWLPLAICMTGKRGGALLLCVLQALLLLITSLPGSHGIWNLVVYILPGVIAEAVYLYKPKAGYGIWHFIAAVMLANFVGVFLTTGLYYRGLSSVALSIVFLLTILSGIIGGVTGNYIMAFINKTKILEKQKEKKPTAPKYLKDYDDNEK